MNPHEQEQEHVRSYYAATASQATAFDRLEGNHSTDICVVGAGFTGVATALTLAERGYEVALVEANRVGWGASGRNGGQLINGFSGRARIQKKHGDEIARLLWDMRWRGIDIIRERISRYDIDCDLRNGFVETALKTRQLAYFERYATDLQRFGHLHHWEIWDESKTRDMLGTDAYRGAFFSHRDGHLHPLNLCIGEANAAAALGVAIFEQSPVTGIRHGDRPMVETESGRIEADAVILAGNAYMRLEQARLSNLVFPASSYIIATEPLAAHTVDEINPLNVAVCDLNTIVDYFRLSADKRLLFGGACHYRAHDPASIGSSMRSRMLKVYPQLAPVRVEYEWGGKMGIVLNRVPALGAVDNNVYYCLGYSGHGVAASHMMGEIMADAVAGTLERFDLFANFRHRRLPGSQRFGQQIIALGMLYYKLKDRL